MARTSSIGLLDRYILRETLGTFGGVIAIVMSLMVLEHLPRLIELTRLSGHRGTIVVQSIAGLLPEYAGIGSIVALYLAIALTVRKLSSRGELAAIEANGIGPSRWMRLPMLLAATVAVFAFINQGWLMPAGEQKLQEIGRRMAIGDFGYNLQARTFTELGRDTTLWFNGLDDQSGALTGIFIRTKAQTFQAASGQLSIAPEGSGFLLLDHGNVVEGDRVLRFERLAYSLPPIDGMSTYNQKRDEGWRQVSLDKLLQANNPSARRAGLARLLWFELALLVPILSLVFGSPPLRQSGGVGLLVGLILLVVAIKTIDTSAGGEFGAPWVTVSLVGLSWVVAAVTLLALHFRTGPGLVDRWLSIGLANLQSSFVSGSRALPENLAEQGCNADPIAGVR